jgi:hypothetical protein
MRPIKPGGASLAPHAARTKFGPSERYAEQNEGGDDGRHNGDRFGRHG